MGVEWVGYRPKAVLEIFRLGLEGERKEIVTGRMRLWSPSPAVARRLFPTAGTSPISMFLSEAA